MCEKHILAFVMKKRQKELTYEFHFFANNCNKRIRTWCNLFSCSIGTVFKLRNIKNSRPVY